MTYAPFNSWQNAPFGPNVQTELDVLRMQQHALLQQQELLRKQQEILLEQQQNKLQAMNMAQDIGQLIARRRTSLGLDHQQLADLSSINVYDIIQIESGNLCGITMEKCLTVMAALRLHLSAYPV